MNKPGISKHVQTLCWKQTCLNGHVIPKNQAHESQVIVRIDNGRMTVEHKLLCGPCAGWPEKPPALPA